MKTPKISVNMTCYNSAKFIGEAIASVLSQSYQDFELVIVDDGSTDNSRDIINSFNDSRIRLIENGNNKGIAYARNKALQESRGEYIAILDSDDIAYPNRLEEQVKYLDSHPEVGAASGRAEYFNDNGMIRKEKGIYRDKLIKPALLFANCFVNSTMMIRRDLLLKEGYNLEFSVCQDFELFSRLKYKSNFKNLHKTLIRYRVHESNISSQKESMANVNRRRILRNQLAILGINPTEDEIILHDKIGSSDFEISYEWIHKAESWLLKIKEANYIKHIYDESALDIDITGKWGRICGKAGFTAWSFIACFSSALRPNNFYIFYMLFQYIKTSLGRLIRG